MASHSEIELKFELASGDVDRLRRAPELAAIDRLDETLHADYFDTPPHDLRKAGYTLRVRRSGERFVQTLKLQEPGRGLFDRREWEARVTTMQPDLGMLRSTPLASTLMTSLEKKLAKIATVEVERTTWCVERQNALIEVTLDQGSAGANSRMQPVTELELELKSGPEKSLFRLSDQLAEAVPLRLSVISKADRALSIAHGRSEKITKAPRIVLRRDWSVAEAFTAIVLSCVKHFRLNEPILLERRSPEALHQLRVAFRRLRTAFRFFRPVLRRSRRYRSLDKGIRRYSRVLGEGRNLDVFLDLARNRSVAAPHVERQRDASYDRIMAMLNSPPFLATMMRLIRWLTVGKWRLSPRAALPVHRFAMKRLDKAWAQIEGQPTSLSGLTEERRHRFRVRIKQFRYMLDFVRSVSRDGSGKRKAFRLSLEALQDDLGALNDISSAEGFAATAGIPIRQLIDKSSKARLLRQSERRYAELLAIGPYWTVDGAAKPPEAAGAHRRASTARPGASRRRAPRSGGSARG